MYYDTGVYWNKGDVSDVNQDSLVLMQALTAMGRVLMAAVCDGRGGAGMDECASGYLTKELMEWFYEGLPDALSRKRPLCAIRRSVDRKLCRVQCRMREYVEGCGQEMGTTLSMLLLWEKKYMLWKLGDSRIYRLTSGRRKEIRMMGTEHMEKPGNPAECIGSRGFFSPEYMTGTIKSGEAFLLCSDAFRRRMTPEEIADVLTPAHMTEERCKKRLREIGEAVMRRGERDDLSAVYVKASAHRKGDIMRQGRRNKVNIWKKPEEYTEEDYIKGL